MPEQKSWIEYCLRSKISALEHEWCCRKPLKIGLCVQTSSNRSKTSTDEHHVEWVKEMVFENCRLTNAFSKSNLEWLRKYCISALALRDCFVKNLTTIVPQSTFMPVGLVFYDFGLLDWGDKSITAKGCEGHTEGEVCKVLLWLEMEMYCREKG